jgi:uncharacterized BrkB/YihY/UPF0761 family membrane protein
MIILLLWLYLTALAILLGGAVNAILDEKSGVIKTAGDANQMLKEKSKTSDERER